MKKFDLLLIDEKTNTTDCIFIDLCFDKIKDAVFTGKSHLYERFCEVLSHPSRDANTVAERRKIFEDFCEHPYLAGNLLSLCNESAECKDKVYHNYDKYKQHLEQTLALIEVYNSLSDLLRGMSFKSKTLLNANINRCDGLSDELKHAYRITERKNYHDEHIICDGLSLKVNFTNGFKLKSASLENIGPVKLTPKKKGKEIVRYDENYFIFGGTSMSKYVFDDIYKNCVTHVSSILTQINFNIRQFFIQLKSCVEFYQAAMLLKSYLDTNSLSYCMPEMVSEKGINAAELYDLSLSAYQNKRPLVKNSFDCKDGNIIVITGLNQGGKTTFLRSVGIAQLLAQAGLFVPAEEYSCCCFCGILTHFPTEENNSLDYGKLAEELTRLNKDFPILINGGLVLFNESFATTTAREGAEISFDVIRALSKTESTVLFVTHLYEFATKLDNLNDHLYNGAKAVSMVTEFKNKDVRTYKIVKGEPLDNIYAADYLFL